MNGATENKIWLDLFLLIVFLKVQATTSAVILTFSNQTSKPQTGLYFSAQVGRLVGFSATASVSILFTPS